MPKIKAIPTPTQARILKAFIDYPNLKLINGHRGYQWNGDWKAARKVEKPRSSTINKMLKEEWLGKDEKYQYFIVITDVGRNAIVDFEDDDFVSIAKSGYNEGQVIEALKGRFSEPDWLFISPLYLPDNGGWGKGRYADGFALRIRAGDGRNKYLDRWAFEVKVDRSDFKRELDDPEKKESAMDIAHYFAFVAPQGLIHDHELPDKCGLLEVMTNGKVRMKVRAMRLSSPREVGWDFVAQIARYWIPEK